MPWCPALRCSSCFLLPRGTSSSNCRVMTLDSSGAMSGGIVASWELENLKAVGRLFDAWSSPAGLELGELAASADAGSTVISSGVYLEVPL